MLYFQNIKKRLEITGIIIIYSITSIQPCKLYYYQIQVSVYLQHLSFSRYNFPSCSCLVYIIHFWTWQGYMKRPISPPGPLFFKYLSYDKCATRGRKEDRMDVGWERTKVFADWSLLQVQLDTKQRLE